ncbi:hypothetical protein [Mesorhizobium sp. M4B.F.Ca.ET.089.01.1.1]|uniref:hypothetical protein n=1 Tax=Mesorhizobium sp. M4B.F.Ca.ET.089.01.1.1 TaxID=2496662 RepID=UPI001FE06A46|nr:hypothetical protein [Mesorhizobium sp. M4B.F.Ca.ET.089.01.1.1]
MEIFHGGERIAVHVRASSNGRHATIAVHMPPNHQRYREWTPAKIRSEANRIGPMLRVLVDRIIEKRAHPEQGYRACVGIIGLERRFGADRLEAAAQRALEFQVLNYPGIKSFSKRNWTASPGPSASSRIRSSTPTSAAPDTTLKVTRNAQTSHTQPAAAAGVCRYG